MNDCRFVSTSEPRQLRNRHLPDCENTTCRGCQPCPENHCSQCRHAHIPTSQKTCGLCIHGVRDNLKAVTRLSEKLLDEAMNKGVNSEAAALAGPAIKTLEGIEAFEYRRMSFLMGRIPQLEQDDRHPLWILGSWEMIIRQHLSQEAKPGQRVTLLDARDYIDTQLHVLAHDPHFPFDELMQDLWRCARHLENVLRDGVREERTQVPCLDCGRRLERRYAAAVANDHHICPRCERTYDPKEFARAKADWLAADEANRYVLIGEAAKAVERSEYTVRTWIRRLQVASICDVKTHRLKVWWPDIRDTNRETRTHELLRKVRRAV